MTFIGPPAEPMQALGDKIGSTIIAQSAGVPTIAWNAADLRVDYTADGIPDEVYQKANITSADQALDAAVKIGFPVMIKASEGGGGKGIRKVRFGLSPAEICVLTHEYICIEEWRFIDNTPCTTYFNFAIFDFCFILSGDSR